MRGRVISATRRYLSILDDQKRRIEARAATKAVNAVVGDLVEFKEEGGEALVVSILDRKNCFFRSLGKKSKEIASNIDLLCIVAAPEPLFSTTVIDKILVSCSYEEIPTLLVLNKSDLELGSTEETFKNYESIGVPTTRISAKTGFNLESLTHRLTDPSNKIVVLTGVSGVGKSTLLNRLIAGVDRTVGQVSDRTGQGRQTTSQASGYLLDRPEGDPLIVVDLPGFQSFSITHIDERTLSQLFPEFTKVSQGCAFPDCRHLNEPDCAVKVALEKQEIAASRFESYLKCLEEIEKFREY